MWLAGLWAGITGPRIVADFFHQHPQTPRHPPPAPEPQGTQARPAGLSHHQACFSVGLKTEGLVCVFVHVCMYLCVPSSPGVHTGVHFWPTCCAQDRRL